MAQQQRPRREEFGNDQRDYDVREGDPDVVKPNEELDRWRDEFGSRTGLDPVAHYTYGTVGSGGYGAPPTGGPYSGTNYAASGFEYSTAYAATGAAPAHEEPNADPARDRDTNTTNTNNMNLNRDRDRNTNVARDQK